MELKISAWKEAGFWTEADDDYEWHIHHLGVILSILKAAGIKSQRKSDRLNTPALWPCGCLSKPEQTDSEVLMSGLSSKLKAWLGNEWLHLREDINSDHWAQTLQKKYDRGCWIKQLVVLWDSDSKSLFILCMWSNFHYWTFSNFELNCMLIHHITIPTPQLHTANTHCTVCMIS